MMALSPELQRMVSEARVLYGPGEAKTAEFLSRQAYAERELACLSCHESKLSRSSIREQLAWLGYYKATKRELRHIVKMAIKPHPEG